MKGVAMGMPISKSVLISGIVLFALGTVTGGLIAYRHEIRDRLGPSPGNNQATSQQPTAQSSPPMADMKGMSASADPTTSQQPTPQSSPPMADMKGMDASTNPAQPNQNSSPQKMAPGTVMLSSDSQQLIGVRYAEVRRQRMERTIRAVGVVQMDDEKISRVHVKTAGYVQKVYLGYVGKLVKKGQPLFTLYSPELVSTEQEYLIALKGQEYLSQAPNSDAVSGAASLLRATRERLRLWDISDAQIQALEETRRVEQNMTLYSPTTGFVMTRNVYEQSYVAPETELYDIADLSTIWVLVDIYEYEAPFVHVGQAGSMQLSFLPGKSFHGRVDYVYPTLDPATRTMKVRLVFPNPDFALKPSMYADVELKIDYGMQTLVPSEAVLNSGTRQVVFMPMPGGYFEPREIKVGAQFDGQYAVLAGLKPGDRIVASGNFLIDSESRLGTATQGMAGMPGMSPTKK